GKLAAIHVKTLFAQDAAEVETFRLTAAAQRFSQLCDGIGALGQLAKIQGVSKIDSFDDLVPLLFQHTVYKSYPTSLLDKGNFRALNRWLRNLTTREIDKVDLSRCTSIREWLVTLQEQTDVYAIHTTGTSGKISVLPRTFGESRILANAFMARWQGFGAERDVVLDPTSSEKIILISPGYRHGFYAANRTLDQIVALISDEAHTECMYDETLDPDVLTLAGRIMTAEANGTIGQLKIAAAMLKNYQQVRQRRASSHDEAEHFFERVFSKYQGRAIVVGTATPSLWTWVNIGLKRGLKGIFSPDSLVAIGGGTKGAAIPANWREIAAEVIGAPVKQVYGMSELCGVMTACDHGNYHVPPQIIPFVLDPESGNALPRNGTQTGRAAFFDLAVSTYWGGFITGDQATIHWDGGCACGRRGAWFESDIRRYSEVTGQDDKITCAGVPDAHLKAVEFLNRAVGELPQ
ncbi:MAG: hypothetical protein ABW049_00070, partial [Spongiibacteraceae bacterium]